MEVELGLVPLEFTKALLVVFGWLLLASLVKVDQRSLANILAKKIKQNSQQFFVNVNTIINNLNIF